MSEPLLRNDMTLLARLAAAREADAAVADMSVESCLEPTIVARPKYVSKAAFLTKQCATEKRVPSKSDKQQRERRLIRVA